MGSSRETRALIFDFDGLIIDSESPGFQAWSEVYSSYGCSLPLEKYSACIGTIDGFDLHGHLQELTGRALDRGQLQATCTARWLELMARQPLLPGVEACIERARSRGLRLAVASSSTGDWVRGHLDRFALLDRFDAICTRDEVPTVKPDPALYLLALERLGVSPEQAIAFEDSPNGILAAKRAGLFCVVIPNLLTSQLALDMADRQLHSFDEFDLDDV